MKDTIKWFGIIALVAVIGFTGCNKKAGAQEGGSGSSSSESSSASGNASGAVSAVASLKETPTSDFAYELSKDGQGIVITRYTGQNGTIVIPAKIEDFPVVEIGENAFRRDFITSIVIPDTVTKIGSSAFFGTNITNITIPDSVKEIGKSAFERNNNLTEAKLPNGLKVIPRELFRMCGKLTTVNLPTNLEQIQISAFAYCGELNNLIVPETLQSVRFEKDYGTQAFEGCGKLPIRTRQTIEGWGYTGSF